MLDDYLCTITIEELSEKYYSEYEVYYGNSQPSMGSYADMEECPKEAED